MGIFSEVEFTWGDKTYKVPPDKVLQLIAVIEEHITIEELTTGKFPRAKIAQAFTAALRFAGAFPQVDQVYAALFNVEDARRIMQTVDALLSVMIPPESLKKMIAAPPAGGTTPAKKKKTGA